jgi:hypothetical protein
VGNKRFYKITGARLMATSDNPVELKPPRIKKIFVEKQTIYVLFINDKIKKFSVVPLLNKIHFEKLKNLSYLKSAKVDPGGYGISWDDECDLSENELWTKGELINDILELERLHVVWNAE